MTAGLEANLHLAMGARIILCRSIDRKAGVANSAIGTLQNMSMTQSLLNLITYTQYIHSDAFGWAMYSSSGT